MGREAHFPQRQREATGQRNLAQMPQANEAMIPRATMTHVCSGIGIAQSREDNRDVKTVSKGVAKQGATGWNIHNDAQPRAAV